MMLDHYYAVIMAGGGGTRLWPLSRKKSPKQILRLFDDRSLFQTAVDRLAGLLPPERIFVVTVQDQAQTLQEECPEIPGENFIIEPMPRGTASVVALAAVVLRKLDQDAVMAVLTADHFMKDVDYFRKLLKSAYYAAQDELLVTLGIEPTFASTGFGYVHRGELIKHYSDLDVYRVIRFTEKPDQEQAERFIQSAEFLWNSGMFFWRVDQVLSEIELQMPALYQTISHIFNVLGTSEQNEIIKKLWPNIQPETIDYGIMEGASRVAVIPASGLGWSDVGSWDSLFELMEADSNGNIFVGKELMVEDTRDSLIYAREGHQLIVTIGVENLVVVDTGDVLMVCSKDQAQDVRQIVEKLRETTSPYL